MLPLPPNLDQPPNTALTVIEGPTLCQVALRHRATDPSISIPSRFLVPGNSPSQVLAFLHASN